MGMKKKEKVQSSVCRFLLKKSIDSAFNFKIQDKLTKKNFYTHVYMHPKNTVVIKP